MYRVLIFQVLPTECLSIGGRAKPYSWLDLCIFRNSWGGRGNTISSALLGTLPSTSCLARGY
jgi:hypothetical protein